MVHKSLWQCSKNLLKISTFEISDSEDWKSVPLPTYIPFNSETQVLEIKTDSADFSGDSMNVTLKDSVGTHIGYIYMDWYTDGYQYYKLGQCVDSWTYFSPPEEQDKIWRIIKTSSRLTIQCNEVTLLHVYINTECKSPEDWSKTVGQIEFSSRDDASDAYRLTEYTGRNCRNIHSLHSA